MAKTGGYRIPVNTACMCTLTHRHTAAMDKPSASSLYNLPIWILPISPLKPVRNNMNKTIHFIATVLAIAGSFSAVQAQENFYRVYQYETPLKGHLELTQWTTYIPNSSQSYDYFGKYL